MGQPLNKEVAAHLWQYVTVGTRNHRLLPKQHKGNVLFVGYADITLQIGGVDFLSLPGTSIKLMGDQVHFDPKQEKARDGSDRYFPVWLPVSAESRAVLSELIKADSDIIEMVEQAVAKVTVQAPTGSSDSNGNPFSG
jgi:hypothetical protein